MKSLTILGGLCIAVSAVACGAGTAKDSSAAAAGGATAASPASAPVLQAGAAVPHEKLVALFPTIPGFRRETEPQGDTDGGISRAQGDYVQEGGGTAGLSVEMMDVSTNAMMLSAFKEIQRHPGVQKTDVGTQKTTTIAGYPAYEEWTPEGTNGVLSVLVAGRFLVSITGHGVGNVDVMYRAMDAIDLRKIATLK